MAPDARIHSHMHTQTRSHKQNSSFSLITLYSFVRRGSQRLIHCLTDSLRQGGKLRIGKNFTICTLCKHDLRNISSQKLKAALWRSTVEEEDGAAGSLSESAVETLSISRVCWEIRNDCSILWRLKTVIFLFLQPPVGVCLVMSMLLVLQLMMTYERLT